MALQQIVTFVFILSCFYTDAARFTNHYGTTVDADANSEATVKFQYELDSKSDLGGFYVSCGYFTSSGFQALVSKKENGDVTARGDAKAWSSNDVSGSIGFTFSSVGENDEKSYICRMVQPGGGEPIMSPLVKLNVNSA